MDVQTWTALSRLLDDALDLPPDDRLKWLDGLPHDYDRLKPRLRAMLDRADSLGDDVFMATLSKVDLDGLDDTDIEDPLTQPGAIVGPFRLVRPLASGGQAAVWLGERVDGLVNRPVAIKLPHGFAHRPGLADRMARERDILATLTHPNIARLYDAGVTPAGVQYLALEYVEGDPIDRHCTDRGLDVPARLRLFLQIVRAVAFAHGHLVIHRDLKPSNVLVTPGGDVRLLDFGIARILDDPGVGDGVVGDSTLTAAGGRAMTPAYASPEQIARAPLGVATDIYSLGVMLYELLAGRRPYAAARDTPAAVEEAILHQDANRPSDVAPAAIRPTLAGDLDTIVLKALKKTPADRYGTAAAFAEDIERYLAGEPVLARPDSPWYRARKFIARNRVAVGAAALVLLAILIGASVAVWQAQVAQREQARAQAVTTFISSIFRDINPDLRGKDRPLTAAEVLSRAADQVDTRLPASPEVRAELLRILGESLLGAGDPDRAAAVLAKALPESVAAFSSDAPEAVEAGLLLANAEHYVGKSEDAARHLDEVIAALKRTGRLDTEDFVKAKLEQTSILINGGRAMTPEAEAVAKQAYEAAERILPPVHKLRAAAASDLGAVYRTQSKNDLALKYTEEGYRVRLEAHGRDVKHPSVILAQNEYGRALFQTGRAGPAIEQMREAAEHGMDTFRDNAMFRQHLLGTLSNVQLFYGEIKESLVNLDRATSIDVAGVKLSDTYRASQSVVRGRILAAARRPAEALPHYQTAIAGYEKGPDKNMVVGLQGEHAEVLAQLGRFDEARPVLSRIAAGRGERLRPAERRALRVLATLQRLEGRPALALPLLEEAQLRQPQSARDRLDNAQVQLEFGLTWIDLRRFDDAARVLADARRTLEDEQGPTTPALADTLVALGRVHAARGQCIEAEPLLGEADRFWRDFDAANPAGGAAAFYLAKCLDASGRPADAVAASKRARQLLVSSPIAAERALAR